MFRPPFSLKAQLMAVFGALVLVSSAAITWELSEMLRARVRSDAGRSLGYIASNAAKMFDAGLRANATAVEVLGRREGLWRDSLDSAQTRHTLDILAIALDRVAWAGVTDNDGRVRAATGGLLVGVDASHRPWFQNGRKALFASELHAATLLEPQLPATVTGEPLRFLDYAAPIRRDGRTIGVLAIHIRWEWAADVIETVLSAEARSAGIEVFIFDRRGNLIFAPGGQTPELAQGGLRMPDARPEAALAHWHDGDAFLTATARLPAGMPGGDLGWTVVAREPAYNSTAAVDAATRTALLIGTLVALLGTLLVGIAANRFGADVRRMARAVRDVEAGVPGARIPSAGSSIEMRTLARAVGSMTHRLVTAREELELQVRHRTRELETANVELGRQARTDALTGLVNRRIFDPMLERMLGDARRNGRPLSVLMIDADHFKRINDIHGHPVGDQVLRSLADMLRARLRAGDVVARFGGEEFAVLLPDANAANARLVAQSLVQGIAGHSDPVWGVVTVSIGVASCDGGPITAEEMLRQADEALYRAKAEGRNRVVVHGKD
jgi:diguanylate cyclase (GGDEF)-like protein